MFIDAARDRILVLGGYGNFGARVCRGLARLGVADIIVAGRRLERARALAEDLSRACSSGTIGAVALDQSAVGFAERLSECRPAVVVHAAGPFQTQAYDVALACLACGSHYVDLADSRRFVADFARLNDEALRRNVLLVSGASTLPGLSSSIVDHLGASFSAVRAIEISIAPANRTTGGIGTIAAVLSYCGRPFLTLRHGSWRTVYGWQDLRRVQYPDWNRWAAACDVPDLEIFPDRYSGVETVTFHAGLELWWQQWMLWMMAWLTRLGLVRSWMPRAESFRRLSERFVSVGTDTGAMYVRVSGEDAARRPFRRTFYLSARNNHGPEIPAVPAIVLAERLVTGRLELRGAVPCLGLLSLEDFSRAIAEFDISWTIVEEGGTA